MLRFQGCLGIDPATWRVHDDSHDFSERRDSISKSLSGNWMSSFFRCLRSRISSTAFSFHIPLRSLKYAEQMWDISRALNAIVAPDDIVALPLISVFRPFMPHAVAIAAHDVWLACFLHLRPCANTFLFFHSPSLSRLMSTFHSYLLSLLISCYWSLDWTRSNIDHRWTTTNRATQSRRPPAMGKIKEKS